MRTQIGWLELFPRVVYDVLHNKGNAWLHLPRGTCLPGQLLPTSFCPALSCSTWALAQGQGDKPRAWVRNAEWVRGWGRPKIRKSYAGVWRKYKENKLTSNPLCLLWRCMVRVRWSWCIYVQTWFNAFWDHCVWVWGERYEVVWQRQGCFSGHCRGWHLCVLTLGMISSWHSLRLKFSLKSILRSSTDHYGEWNPSCPCPVSRMPRHGLSVHLLWPSLICFFHENQNIFKKMPPQLQGRSEFWVLTSLLQKSTRSFFSKA